MCYLLNSEILTITYNCTCVILSSYYYFVPFFYRNSHEQYMPYMTVDKAIKYVCVCVCVYTCMCVCLGVCIVYIQVSVHAFVPRKL